MTQKVECTCYLQVEGGPPYRHSQTCPVFGAYWDAEKQRLADRETPSDGCGDTVTDPGVGDGSEIHDHTRQVVVHPAAWAAFNAWLRSRNLMLARMSRATEEELATYVISYPAGEQNDSPTSGATGLGTGRLSDL